MAGDVDDEPLRAEAIGGPCDGGHLGTVVTHERRRSRIGQETGNS
jgi:hypothetical protein